MIVMSVIQGLLILKNVYHIHKGNPMQVQLRNNVFTATQWFKDGDYPAVEYHPQFMYHAPYYGIETVYDYDGLDTHVIPGDWIVEMFDGIHLYSDDEFKNFFKEMERNNGY